MNPVENILLYIVLGIAALVFVFVFMILFGRFVVWFDSRDNNIAKEASKDSLYEHFRKHPKLQWLNDLSVKDKETFESVVSLMQFTDQMAVADSAGIDPDQDLAEASLFALEEDKQLEIAEKMVENENLRGFIQVRRDKLWAEDGLIGQLAQKFKRP